MSDKPNIAAKGKARKQTKRDRSQSTANTGKTRRLAHTHAAERRVLVCKSIIAKHRIEYALLHRLKRKVQANG
jgi:hypothetical protein